MLTPKLEINDNAIIATNNDSVRYKMIEIKRNDIMVIKMTPDYKNVGTPVGTTIIQNHFCCIP